MNFLLPLIVLASIGTAHAQISISADVDKTDVALNEQIVLGVTVTGPEASLPEPEIPSLPNFSIYSSGRNQSITFVNGKVSSSIVFTYVLEPRFVGKGVIPPISVTYQGHQAQTSPIEIQVRKPGGAGPSPTQAGGSQTGGPPVVPPQAGQAGRVPAARPTTPVTAPTRAGQSAPVFVQAQVDKKSAFVNEQITMTIGFYTAINLLGNPQYIAPKTDGFLAEDLPPERHGQRVISGRNYYYSEIKTALFPAHAGRLTISPATVRVQIQQSMGIDPTTPDFFERFFAGGLIGAQTRELASEPLIITAQALPEEGKPKGFSGAVGAFSISAAADRTQVKVGDAVSLTVTVSGDGNLKAIGDPVMPELPSFRVYETVSSLNLSKKEDKVQGSKVFKTVLVPRVSGELAVAPITFSYFDPAKHSYLTAQTLPLSIKVAPAPGGGAVPAGSPTAGAVAPQGLSSVIEDIRYLHAGPRPWSTRVLEAVAGAGPVNAVPFLIFAFCVGLVQYREFGLSDPLGTRHRRAWKAASHRIKQASQLAASDPHRSAGLMADALSNYLADKLGQPASGLTLRGVQDLLRAKKPGLEPATLERIRELWDELDMRRFAPAQAVNGEQAHVADSLRQLLEELEKELKR